ncbi:MAG: hypothetical protein ABL866_09675 [Devosia sp.]
MNTDISTLRALGRGAIGLIVLALIVLLPRPAGAQELTDADKAISNIVAIGDPAGIAPAAWLGATPHFVMVGTFKGYSFNIQATDLSAIPDISVEAKREYRAAEGGGLDYVDFEIAADLTTNGIERGIELEFENADFADHPVPSSFALKDAEFPEGLFSNMELQIEWEWVEKSVIVNEEQLYTDGTLIMAHESGDKAADARPPPA